MINAFESICKDIKSSGENNPINYYESVEMAYLESKDLNILAMILPTKD
jgi:hypothetical protein